MKNICIIAGEASGDMHGALLVKALQNELNASKFWGIAGPLMREAGVEAFIQTDNLAVFGISELLSQYFLISRCYKQIRYEISKRKPDAVIFIDYPGFNLRLIQDVYALGITTIYHIPPKAWSHGANRASILRDAAYLVTSILPFEIPFFKAKGVSISFVGNPIKDAVKEYLEQHKITSSETARVKYRIGLLPGSRANEIKKLLPILIEAFIKLHQKIDKVTGMIPIAPTLDPNFVKEIAYKAAHASGVTTEWLNKHVSFGMGNAYEVMSSSHYAWVCSGTASLETAFFNTPQSVVYKVSPLTAYVARKIVVVKYVSLVNLIANKEVVPEFLQERATAANLVEHAYNMLTSAKAGPEMTAQFQHIAAKFPPHAAQNAAKEILECIKTYDLPFSEKFKYQNWKKTKGTT